MTIPFPLSEKTLVELQNAMTSGELTARQIVELYLERINQLDKQNPTVNAIIEINPDALTIADELDVERTEKRARSPLHGIPIVLKDNIDTADKMETTAGSMALAGHVALRDAYLVEQLRAAGAIILAKANLSEWANFRSSRSSSGWSSRGGQTRNPYALDRTPCGSSSGSAVAVAANFCAAAIGTETDGSVVCPSHTNGVVGIKPTLGLVSRSGIIPIAHSQDTAGPMGRTVADATAVLSALVGIDPRDPITAESEGKAHTDYTQFLDANGLKGARIGVARNFFGYNPNVDAIIETCIEVMRKQGAEIIEDTNIDTETAVGPTELEVLLYEFKADLNGYLAATNTNMRSMTDIIAFNDANTNVTMPYFGQERFLEANEKGSLQSAAYLEALADNHRLMREEGIDKVVQEHNLDAIIAPTGGPAWLIDWVNGDHYGGASSTPAAVAGYPNITVPAGFIHGLPIGISFFSTAYQEPTLIKLAYAFEQATKVRKPPQFLPTIQF